MDTVHPTRRIETHPWFFPLDGSHVTRFVLFLLTVGLFIAARFWQVSSNSLSFDEIFSVHAVNHDWSGMIAFVRQDMVHPPLFYILLKIWVAIGGESLPWLKLFSTVIAAASIFPLLQLFRELSLQPTEKNLAVVLMAVNGFLLYYSQLLRMYSLLLFLGLCSLWLFVSLFKSPVVRWANMWALFGINLLLVYTHYFGWSLVGAELLILVLQRNRKLVPFLISVLLIAICFTPWLHTVAQVHAERGLSTNIGWITRPHLSHLVAFYGILNDKPFDSRWNARLGILLFGYPVAALVWQVLTAHIRGERRDNTFFLLFLLILLPIAIVYLASLSFAQSIWLPRGLIFVAVPYLILVAIAMNRLRPRWIRAAMLFLVLGWAFLAAFKTLGQYAANTTSMNDCILWMVESETDQSKGIRVYTLDEHTPYIIWFYLNSAKDDRFQVRMVQDPTSNRAEYWLTKKMFQTDVVNDLAALDGNHYWIAFNEKEWQGDRTPQKILREAGYRVGEGFQAGPKDSKTYLFPVWRQT